MTLAVVSSTVQRVGDLLISEAKLLYGVSDQIKKVKRELERMEFFLEEADRKQNRDKRVRQWVGEIRELAFKIEDIIETFALEVANNKHWKDISLLRCSCILSEGVSRHNIATEINEIKAELIDLTACLQTYGITKCLDEGETSNSQVNLKNHRTFTSHHVDKDFVGMEKEIKQLVSDLTNIDKVCEVVSICGMGGQGKTTLAQQLYNHALVRVHFEAFAWVCLTQQFDKIKIFKGILKELHPKSEIDFSRGDYRELVNELLKVQQEKSCLIVIDDIWTYDSWRSLKAAFPIKKSSGSKILLTTRYERVAKIGSVHKIEGLTEKESLQLLYKKAGININSETSVTSEIIGRMGMNMVERCNCLPLAISSVGGILRGKSVREWEMINKDISFYLAKGEIVSDDDDYYTARQILGLSYDSLPPRLRRCFLCFANYEEGENIATEELYMFWMAEGLISVEDKAEGEMMLDAAERYLDELAHRSLVQVVRSDIEGVSHSKYIACRVHDLIRDLCLSKIKEEKVINVFHSEPKHKYGSKDTSLVRRLCIRSSAGGIGDELMSIPTDEHMISHIRSLLVWKELPSSPWNLWPLPWSPMISSWPLPSSPRIPWPPKIVSIKKFKLLRVLTVQNYLITKQTMGSISELVYLKYLCLSHCFMKMDRLPSSIAKLRNLETLDLRVQGYLKISNVLWKLKQLQHLYLPVWFEDGSTDKVEKLRLEGLDELELICNYDSEYCDAHNGSQLPKLKVFKGKTTVGNLTKKLLDFFKHREMRHSDLIIEKIPHVEGTACDLVLVLECSFIDVLTIRTSIRIFSMEDDYTRFSGRLTKLVLEGCRMIQDPIILLEKVPNLRDLILRNAYSGKEMVCSATGFPKLQAIHLDSLNELENWRVNEGAMPDLSWLVLENCSRLETIPEGLIYLTALQTLKFVGMHGTNIFSNRIHKQEGVVQGADFYKIRHIPNLIGIPELGMVRQPNFQS